MNNSSVCDVVGVYSRPDRPSGRGGKVAPGPVKQYAIENRLPVHQPQNFRDEEHIEQFRRLNPDLFVVIGYGLILPEVILQTPALGCVNVHASLLPAWRGAAPIQRAIEAGDKVTGVTLMQMEAAPDTGPILAAAAVTVADNETGKSLHDRLSVLGGRLLARNLENIRDRRLLPLAQNHDEASFARKLSKAESRLDWSLPADVLERKIRAFHPWPGAYGQFPGLHLKIIEAEVNADSQNGRAGEIVAADSAGILVRTGKGLLNLKTVQKPGGRPVAAKDFLNGFHIPAGAVLA